VQTLYHIVVFVWSTEHSDG